MLPFVFSAKLRQLEEERQRFIIASIQLISHLNQKILAEMPNSEFVEFQKSLVAKVRETTDLVSSEELQSIIGLIDDSFYNERYPLVFSLEENYEDESVSNGVDVSCSNYLSPSSSISSSCGES